MSKAFVKYFFAFFLLVNVNMTLIAFVEYTPYINVMYMREGWDGAYQTVTTDTDFTVGEPFFLVFDISILVNRRDRLPLFGPRSFAVNISFDPPQIFITTVVQSVGNLRIDENLSPRLVYSFNVPVHPTVVSTDNRPVAVAPSTIRIRCVPLTAGAQEIRVFFPSPSINRGYNRNFIITVRE